jgi:hypothetical protein
MIWRLGLQFISNHSVGLAAGVFNALSQDLRAVLRLAAG